MGKNWTVRDQLIFESDLKDSIIANPAYFSDDPAYKDLEGVDFDEFCDPFFKEF